MRLLRVIAIVVMLLFGASAQAQTNPCPNGYVVSTLGSGPSCIIAVNPVAACTGTVSVPNGIGTFSRAGVRGTGAIALSAGSDPNFLYVSSLTAGSFTVNSRSAMDGNTVLWGQL